MSILSIENEICPEIIDYDVLNEILKKARECVKDRKLMYADVINILSKDLNNEEHKKILRWCTFMIRKDKIYIDI